MKRLHKDDFTNTFWHIIYILVISLPWLLIASLIVLEIIALVNYGSTPVKDMPVWVYFLLGGNSK